VGRSYDTVSFLSDFGSADEFVGVVHSVIRERARHVTIIDLTHHVPRHDIRAGSLTLARAIQYVASGVVLAIVDPGVGTSRRAVAVEVAGGEGVIIGPDNGLLGPAVAMAGGAERAVVLSNTELHLAGPGATFAGRDVFAPVAAHLCNGVDLAELGDAVDPALLLPGIVPLPRLEGDTIAAEVLWVDHFGNVQLNVGPEDLAGWGQHVQLRWRDEVRRANVTTTYGDIGGGIGLVTDSYGLLAIALDRRSASDELGLGAGDGVQVVRFDDDEPRSVSTPVAFPTARK